MVTILGFVSQLVVSAFQLIVVFINGVLLSGGDILATVLRIVSVAAGTAIIVGSVVVMGYLAVGALLREFGVNAASPGRTRVRRD